MSKSQPQQYSAERTEQLLHAAAEGDATLVEALLGAGAYINGTNYNLQTPLIRAAFFGHVDVVRVLLDHGAEVESKDRLGLNALDWATKRGFPEVARMLPTSSAAMATTLDGTPQPDLSGVTLADTGQAEVATPPSPPSQSEDTEVRLDGEPTQPLLHLSAFAREMQRRHEESHGSPAPKHEEFSATMVDGPTLEDVRQEDPPPYEDQPTLEDARTFDDPPTVPLSELPTQMLGDPPTRPLDKFATQLLDEPPTGSLKEFAPQTLAESSTRPLKGIPPPPKSLVPEQTPPAPKSLVPESLPTTAPLSEGATVDESGSRSKAKPGSGRPLTWIVLAIIAVAAIVAAYLMYSRRQVQPVAEPKVAGKATVPQGAFAGSEVSLQLGKGQPTSSTETTTANAGTSNTTLGPDSYPRVTGSLKGSEVSLPDLVTPPTARNRWRRGLINVAVTVGSDGKVISARPLNGQSVWRQAAKDAALKAQFKPQSDAAVRSGKITYHFGPLGQS